MGGVGSGRPSRLDAQEGLREQLAEAYVAGRTHKELAAALSVTPQTIGHWLQDSGVKALVSRLTADRINRLTRKVDARLEALLENPESIRDVKTLLEIRRTLSPTPTSSNLNLSGGVNTNEATAALMKKLNENPELARALLGAQAALPPGDDD